MASRATWVAVGAVLVACGGEAFDAGAGGSGFGGGSGAAGDAGTPDAVVSSAVRVVRATETVLSLEELTFDLGWDPGAGNAILVGITCLSNHQGDCTIPEGGVTDDRGNTYRLVIRSEPLRSSSQAARGYLFLAERVRGGSGGLVVAVDPEGVVGESEQRLVAGALEIEGLSEPPSLGETGLGLVGGGTETVIETDRPLDRGNQLVVALLSLRSEDTNLLITPESGWTSYHVNQRSGGENPPGHSLVARVFDAPGPARHTWTHDEPSRGSVAVIAAFRGPPLD